MILETIKPYFEYIKTPEGLLVFITVILTIIGILVTIYLSKKKKVINNGGSGGNAKASGLNSSAIGGMGGGGGPGGKGGNGGSAEAFGDNSFVMGGEGGEAGQLDRGGRGGRSPLEILGIPNSQLPDGTHLWDYGRGGDGASPSIQNLQKQKFEENKKKYSDPRNSNK